MRLRLFILLILALVSISFACLDTVGHFIPAVVETGGELVHITVKAVPGDGKVFISAFPHTGITTQASAEDAVYYAFLKTGQDKTRCDILISIDGDVAEYVEGPSAGVAFAMLTYAALENKEIKNDVSFTGGVNKKGDTIPVGGLYEKTKALGINKVKYFITPTNSLHERIILSQLKKKYNVEVIEAENLDEVVNFLFLNGTIERKKLTVPIRELPNLENYEVSDLEKFKQVTLKLIDLENQTINNILTTNEDIKEIKILFLTEVNRQTALVDKGYLFSAANDAFLNYIDASTVLNGANPDSININKKIDDVNKCLDSIPKIKKTASNYEWIIGADLRTTWANQRLDSIDTENIVLAEEKYFAFNQIMYADAWCKVASGLINVAGNGGPIEESAWRGIALDKIKEIERLNLSDIELEEHFESAKLAFNNQKYGAALYDSMFAMSMYNSDKTLALTPTLNIVATINRLKTEKRASLWGRIYQTQGALLAQSSSDEDQKNAYRLLQFAKDLDDLNEQIKKYIIQENPSIRGPKLGQGDGKTENIEVELPKLDIEGQSCIPSFIFLSTLMVAFIRRYHN